MIASAPVHVHWPAGKSGVRRIPRAHREPRHRDRARNAIRRGSERPGCTFRSTKEEMMAKYGKKAQSKVRKAMHERKTGSLRSGSSGRKVKSRKQAIAIGLSEARREGGKVPARKSAKKSARKTTKKSAKKAAKKNPAKKSSTKKRATKKSAARKRSS
ncbi:MAG TPA: DUF6496 domain-containing protein [Casimicrobiaceae bacterium]|nr:DUF6496 domain-containing protein [Casimicrobiaceae bacterium]